MTIVETAMASALLAVGVASLANVCATSARLHEVGVEKKAALAAVDAQLSVIEAATFSTLTATYNNTGFTIAKGSTYAVSLDAVANDADGKPGHVTVTAPTNNAAELVEVTISVDWHGVGGDMNVTRRIRLSRLGA